MAAEVRLSAPDSLRPRTPAGRRPLVDGRFEVLLTVASLVSIFGGVVGALWSMPSDVAREGALAVSGLWMCLGLGGVVGADVIGLGFGRVLRAEHIVIPGIVYFLLLDLVQGLYPVTVSADSIQAALIAIGLFASGVSLARVIPVRELPRTIRGWMGREYSELGLLGLIVVCFGLGMFRFVFTSEFSIAQMLDGLQAPRFSAPWSREFGGWDALTEVLINFGYPLATFTVMLALRRRRWMDWAVGVGVVLSGVFLLFVAQGGGRRILGAVIGAGLWTWACGNWGRLRFKGVLGAVVTVAALLALMEVVLDVRSEGWAEYVYESPGSASIRIDDNFLRLAQTIEIVPGGHPHTGFQWIWYVIVRPVPRILWAGKPMDAGFSLPEYVGLEGLSLSSSVIGEWYVGFGWPGVLVGGLLFGVLGRVWSKVLENAVTIKAVGFYSFGVMALFVGVRSLIEVILLSYPLIFWILADRLLRARANGAGGAIVGRHRRGSRASGSGAEA